MPEARELRRLERAVRLGLPIGKTLRPCGSTRARVRHKSRGEICGLCAFTIASEQLARTWMDPRVTAAHARARDARYYQANKEAVRAKNDAWAAAHADEVREYRRTHASGTDQRARRAAWSKANAERMREYKRAHYERVGREAWRAKGKAWRAAHPEQSQAIAAAAKVARRSRLTNVAREHIDRAVVWTRDRGVCHICELPADPNNWHLDHVIPVARGGAHLYSNVGVSHPHCNRRKGARVA